MLRFLSLAPGPDRLAEPGSNGRRQLGRDSRSRAGFTLNLCCPSHCALCRAKRCRKVKLILTLDELVGQSSIESPTLRMKGASSVGRELLTRYQRETGRVEKGWKRHCDPKRRAGTELQLQCLSEVASVQPWLGRNKRREVPQRGLWLVAGGSDRGHCNSSVVTRPAKIAVIALRVPSVFFQTATSCLPNTQRWTDATNVHSTDFSSFDDIAPNVLYHPHATYSAALLVFALLSLRF